jgi:hypothetical protein
MDQILTPEDRKDALIVTANEFRSMMIKNNGNGKFTMVPLPKEVQYSVINGMVVDDFDEDGNLDVALSGNDYGGQPGNGRYDAFNGLVLMGDGKGNFSPRTILQSGLYIPGNGKALTEIMGNNGRTLIAASQNRGALKMFALRNAQPLLPVNPGTTEVMITLKNGKKRKQEIYYGSSFLSQSGRYLKKIPVVVGFEVKNNAGKWVPYK